MKIGVKITIDAEHFTTIIRCLPDTKSVVKNGCFTGAQIGEMTGGLGAINRCFWVLVTANLERMRMDDCCVNEASERRARGENRVI